MSSDTQTRKRKEKKRKKDDSSEEIQNFQKIPAVNKVITPVSEIGITSNVNKDSNGICAKLVFFVLLTALAILIGLIITEHRGLTDVENVDSDSTKFSQIFESWIEKSPADSHGDDDEDLSHENEEIDENEEDEDSEEELNETNEYEHDKTEEDDNEEDEEADEKNHDDDDQEEEEFGDDEENEEDVRESEEEANEYLTEEEENASEEDQSNKEEYEEIEEEEQNQINKRDVVDYENEGNEENNSEEEQEKNEEIIENVKTEDNSQPDESETNSIKNIYNNLPSGSLHVMIKFGVGASIVVVAYIVLVKKWNKGDAEELFDEKAAETVQTKNRRNTIVSPPKLEDIEPDIKITEDKNEHFENEDSENEMESNPTKKKYKELQSTYIKSLGDNLTSQKTELEEDIEDRDEWEYEEDEEDGEDEDNEYDIYENDDDDEELLKRLEAKYGKLPHKQSDEELNKDEQEESEEDDYEEDEDYEESDDDENSNYNTNKHDINVEENENNQITNKINEETKEPDKNVIDELESNLDNKIKEAIDYIPQDPAYALSLINKILEKNSTLPYALYGKAKALDNLAEVKKSNEILEQAIDVYHELLKSDNISKALFKEVAERCIDRMRFRGYFGKAIAVHKYLINKFPEVLNFKYQLVVSYLTINKISEARELLKNILSVHPNDGFALVHYGFVLKTVDNDLKNSVVYLQKGISTGAEGVIDGRFYFHLGDALTKLGKTDEALKVYENGVEKKLFLSKYQRSLYNVDRLKAKPFWEIEEIPHSNYFHFLEQQWEKIRKEGMKLLSEKGTFEDESENLRNVGDWKQYELFVRGRKVKNNCQRCPYTCSLIEKLPDARYCRRGQVKFSVMHPGTHVWPHCGPTNCRLRAHLGLTVPDNTFIRVAGEIKSWKEGKFLIFDDSFEHEVWHNGTGLRLVLIIDIWHPELTEEEKRSLPAI